MVLPTDYHWALRGWLRTHRIRADEAAGILVFRNLNGLLRISGSGHRLAPDERAVVKAGRDWMSNHDIYAADQSLQDTQARHSIETQLDAVLESVCDALSKVGVPAEPYGGLGVLMGHETLEACVQVGDTTRLYELMKAAGYEAEPNWDAEPFRERQWPSS